MSAVIEAPAATLDLQRFSVAPVLADLPSGISFSEQAQLLGVDRRQLLRWRKRGITVLGADDLAYRRGVHPTHFWPEWGAA